jgi:hypothetical protein
VVGENHGDGFLLFDKECILLSTDLYQWPCGTKQNGRNKAACGLDAGMAKRMHVLKNGFWKEEGIKGWKMFMEASPRRERKFVMGMEVMVRDRDFFRERMEGSVCWAVAMSV